MCELFIEQQTKMLKINSNIFKITIIVLVQCFILEINANAGNKTHHVRRSSVDDSFFSKLKPSYRSYQPVSIKYHKATYPREDRPDYDITSYDTEYGGVVSNFTSSIYDDNPQLYPNPEYMSKNNQVDKMQQELKPQEPEVELPDDSLADADLKEHNIIDSVTYLYGFNGCHGVRNEWMILIFITCGLALALLVSAVIWLMWSEYAAEFRRHSKLYPININLCCCLAACMLIYMQAITGLSSPSQCERVALLLHYTHISCAFWIVTLAAAVAEYCVYAFLMPLKFNYLIAYGVPAVLVMFNYALSMEHYEIKHYCWMSIEKGMVLGFMVPAMTLIIINTGIVIIALQSVNKKQAEMLTAKIQELVDHHIANWPRNEPMDDNRNGSLDTLDNIYTPGSSRNSDVIIVLKVHQAKKLAAQLQELVDHHTANCPMHEPMDDNKNGTLRCHAHDNIDTLVDHHTANCPMHEPKDDNKNGTLRCHAHDNIDHHTANCPMHEPMYDNKNGTLRCHAHDNIDTLVDHHTANCPMHELMDDNKNGTLRCHAHDNIATLVYHHTANCPMHEPMYANKNGTLDAHDNIDTLVYHHTANCPMHEPMDDNTKCTLDTHDSHDNIDTPGSNRKNTDSSDTLDKEYGLSEDDLGGSSGDVNGEGNESNPAKTIQDKSLLNMLYMDNLSWKWSWNTEGNELKAYLNLCLVLEPFFAINWVMGVVAIENAAHWSTPTIYLILVVAMYVYLTVTICTTLPILCNKTAACCEEVVTEPQVPRTRTTDSIPLLDPTIQQPNVTPAPADTISTISI